MALKKVYDFILIFNLCFVNKVLCDVHIVHFDFNLKTPFIPQLSYPPVKVQTSGIEYQRRDFQINQVKKRVSERKCEEYTFGTRCELCQNDFDPELNEIARAGEFPHMAFIGKNTETFRNAVICSGSLISPRFVLTAAKCVLNSNIFVMLGYHISRLDMDDKINQLKIPIKGVHIHPNYTEFHNDIALIELASDVTFSFKIRPACLWTKTDTVRRTRAVISTIAVSEGNYHVRKISSSLMRNSECYATLLSGGAKGETNWDLRIDASHICGRQGYEIGALCKSVSGSPMQLVTQDEKSCAFRIIGLTAFAEHCEDRPTIFTRVTSYLNWIESVVWPGE